MMKMIDYFKSLEGKVIKKVSQPEDWSPIFIEFTDGTVTVAKLDAPDEIGLYDEPDMAKTLKDYGWNK